MKFPFRREKPAMTDDRTEPVNGTRSVRFDTDTAPVNSGAVNSLMLSLGQIKPYDRNPRRERNPRFDDIKSSIRAQGALVNPLTITRRPGEEEYMVNAGGNTRLQVLTELYEETQDERFRQVPCLFRPWVAESHVLSAHLIENDLRGELVFIDKALALQALKALLEQESGEMLSRNAFLRRLSELGFHLSKRQSVRFDYAAEILYPNIPMALGAGLGPKDIDRIRKLEAAYRTYWDLNLRPAAMGSNFDELFREALAASDGSDFDLELLRQALEARLAATLDVAINDIRLNVDAVLLDVSRDAEDEEEVDATADDDITHLFDSSEILGAYRPRPDCSQAFAKRGAMAEAKNPESERTALSDLASAPPSQAIGSELESRNRIPTHGIEGDQQPETEQHSEPRQLSGERWSEAADLLPTDLTSIRQRNHDLALQLAKRHHLEDCVLPRSDVGMGFLVDLPPEPLVREDASDEFRQWVWWLLVSLSETAVQPERLTLLGNEQRLGALILANRTDEIFALVGEPDWRALGFRVLNNPVLEDCDLRDLFQLVVNCRRLRKFSQDKGDFTLWQKESLA